MTAAYDCRTCGGHIVDTDPASDAYELEVARHQDGICFGAAGVGR